MPAMRTRTSSDSDGRAERHDRQPAVGARADRDEQRPGDHGGRQADHPDGPEPGDGDRVRVGQVDHRRVERRDAEQDVRDEVDAVERTAGDVRAVEVLDRVDLVGDQQRDEAQTQQTERRRARARAS